MVICGDYKTEAISSSSEALAFSEGERSMGTDRKECDDPSNRRGEQNSLEKGKYTHC